MKPGGWVEFQSVTGMLKSDDDTVPKDSSIQAFATNLLESSRLFGTALDDPYRYKEWFEKRGFVDITVKTFKLPINTWPKDTRMKILGAWEMENLLTSLEVISMRVFQKALGWTEEEVCVFLVDVRKDVKNRNIHAYWPL